MNGPPNGSCRNRMLFSLSSVLALFALSTVFALFQINSIGVRLKEVAEYHIPLTEIITEVESHQLQRSVLFERALRLGEGLSVKADNRRRFEETVKEYDGYAGKVDEALKTGGREVGDAVQAYLWMLVLTGFAFIAIPARFAHGKEIRAMKIPFISLC